MAEYKWYNLTLTVTDPSDRDKFRALSRPDSFYEIRPNRSPGQRGAYSVLMTEDEYRDALQDAGNPNSNLIAVEPEGWGYNHSVPGQQELEYLAADQATTNGLTGSGVDVAVLDSGLGAAVRDKVFSGRIKAAKDFSNTSVYSDPLGHGSGTAPQAVPPKAKLVFAKTHNSAPFPAGPTAAALYWVVDEVGVDIINMSFGFSTDHTIIKDAIANARSKGILLFASRGNEGNSETRWPANYPGVRAISNYSSETDEISSSSSYGDVWAASTGAPNTIYNASGNEFTDSSFGTSGACALATRIAACLMTGGTSAGNVERTMQERARKTGASSQYEGHGVLQLLPASQQLKDEEPAKTNADGSLPLENGAQMTPANGDFPGGLPPGTNVYPEGTTPGGAPEWPTGVQHLGGGDFALPEGGYAQFPSGDVVPLPEGFAGGDYGLGAGTEISPDSSSADPAPEPGYCEENDDGGTGEGEPAEGYWVWTSELSDEAIAVLTGGSPEYAWTDEGGWLAPPLNGCKFYAPETNAHEMGVLSALGWWQSGNQLVRMCPPNSWWRAL